MPAVETARLHLPCPSCGIPQLLTAATRPFEGSGEGARAHLAECSRCWTRRALALNEARAGLRRTGKLAGGPERMTWMGEALDDSHEHDGLLGALVSELLRRDIPASPVALLALPAPWAAPVEEGALRRR